MPDSVSTIVGFSHSRMLALLPRVRAKRRPMQPDVLRTRMWLRGLCHLNMVSAHDNFQSYFLIGSISGPYRHGFAEAIALPGVLGRNPPFRPCGASLRRQPAGAQHADQGAGGGAYTHPHN